MANGENPYENLGLHYAAAAGNDDGVRYALRSGADVNALDAAGKTALMCAIAGDDWQNVDPNDASFMTLERLACIRALVNHPKISLLTLNAPHNSMNGVVPLGMAAWLNLPKVVKLLLEESADAISVDGMDSHGATPLMYAARDGNLEVVQLLLSHGARPDFRDSNYRTSIQFALPHYQTLWLCEVALRRHRWREVMSADRPPVSLSEHVLELVTHSLPSSDNLDPPAAYIFNRNAISRLQATLLTSIGSEDLSFLHSLLFSPAIAPSSPPSLYPMSVPVLVNLPDAKGWSLIHHAVSVNFPSIDVLDALYCAGADMALFTIEEQWTPLHILAQSSFASDDQDRSASLYELVSHLIRDLRAPLSARDKNDETCIHLAAEHGYSIELLACLLDMDKTGIRQLKNSRGHVLTAMQVAKPQFLAAFGADDGIERLISAPLESSSNPAPSPNDSFASLSELSEHLMQDDSSSIVPLSDFDFALSTQQLLLESLMADSRQHQESLVRYFRDRVKDIEKEVAQLKANAAKVSTFRGIIAQAARDKSSLRGVQTLPPRRHHRESEDSTQTICEPEPSSRFSHDMSPIELEGPQQPFDTIKAPKKGSRLKRSSLGALSSLFDRPNTAVYHARVEYHEDQRTQDSRLLSPISTPDFKLEKRKRKESSGTRLKAWFKRIVNSPSQQDLKNGNLPPSPVSPTPTSTASEPPPTPARARIVDRLRPPTIYLSTPDSIQKTDSTIDGALITSTIVLDAAQRDIQRIYACLAAAQEFIDLAHHSITKVERATKRALKKRRAMIAKLRESEAGAVWYDGEIVTSSAKSSENCSPGLLGYSTAVSLRPSIASIRSTHSSIASAAPTITENDDEDTRVIRRLLCRKIEAQMAGAWDETERVVAWLRVVKEAIRGVKRRAYLTSL
ncbi:hypothetical protein NMY22_g7722 [Coprinellus aureogranulatus]|nr:hypothetical protein NMY22_g7722 [Coprinellus aureogranulatus]